MRDTVSLHLPRCSSPAVPPWGTWQPLAAAALLILALQPASVHAAPQLKVLYDGGQTVPVAQFYAPMFDQSLPQAASGPTSPPSPVAANLFPVRTTGMAAGNFSGWNNLKGTSFLLHPIFIVGDDPISRAWLSKNKVRLQQSSATGIVVNVESADRFKSLQSLVPGVLMTPNPGDEVAQALGLRVYPVLIQTNGIASQEVK